VLNTYPKSRKPQSCQLWSRHSGFSLLELLIGVVVLGTLVSIAIPSFQTMMENIRIRTAAESVLNGLQKARAEAITRNTNVAFTLGADTAWTICVSSCTDSPGEQIETRSGNDGSKNITHSSLAADLSAAETVTFNNLGRIANANVDGTKQLALIDFSGTVAGSREMRIIIGVLDAGTGTYIGSSPKMCDPIISSPHPGAC
jgi:type IV fimbrial biogenesis protein FimT